MTVESGDSQTWRGGLTPQQVQVDGDLRQLLDQLNIGRFVNVEPGRYICQRDTTHVDVRLMQYGDYVAVRSLAPVAVGVKFTPELFRFLLFRNTGFLFGGFGVEMWRAGPVVVFTHSILASSMDEQELAASVVTVLDTANRYGGQIVDRWGGRTMQQTSIEVLLPARIQALLDIAE